MSNLKRAMQALLFDQYDTGDLECDDSDKRFIEVIIDGLVEKNDNRCPFKKYDCEHYCFNTHKCNDSETEIDCGMVPETVWANFIDFEEVEG